jgi:hypothetical protein
MYNSIQAQIEINDKSNLTILKAQNYHNQINSDGNHATRAIEIGIITNGHKIKFLVCRQSAICLQQKL